MHQIWCLTIGGGETLGFDDRLRTLASDKGLNIKKVFAEIGFSYRTVQNYFAGISLPNGDFFKGLNKKTGVSTSWLLPAKGPVHQPFEHQNLQPDAKSLDVLPIPRFSMDASAGGGASVDEEAQAGFYVFNRRWLDRRQLDPGSLAVIAVRGDSMEPKLSDGDLILVDRAQRQIAYVLRIDTDLLVKNVQRVRSGVIALFSANALYPPREMDAEGLGGVVGIIGRVVASMQE